MCNLETVAEEVQKTRKVRKIDCNSRYCTNSIRHSPDCGDCHCERYFGPDVKETITFTTPQYCPSCQYWFKGPGSQHLR
ncbi:hypothetical protein M404DRAFT_13842 [Pisolithus tinctorius Marx 270]|uniref:Uncharacterized protein n=1 Tax=Pisolithus tinctorius Marx 270 TaxID=870435 RepID=A0A0C3PMC9_PISTI|nr:hypothetical protein M404DRAFT_13842 [Pisolithus tinctorius Marx 270]